MKNPEREPACRRRSNRGDCSTRDAGRPLFFRAATDRAPKRSYADDRVRSSVPLSVRALERRWSRQVQSPPCCKPTAALRTPERLQQFELSWCCVSSDSSQHAQHTADWDDLAQFPPGQCPCGNPNPIKRAVVLIF